jgi:hypothetical protein
MAATPAEATTHPRRGPAARTPYGFGSLGACPGHNQTRQTAARETRLSFSISDEFPPNTCVLNVRANHGDGWASRGRNLGKPVPAERVDAGSRKSGQIGAQRGHGRRCPASMPPEATTRAAHRTAAELHITSGEAFLQKSRPRGPDDHVGQGAAVSMTMILLRIAECQEGTEPLRVGLIGAERQQAHDQRRSKESHRSCSPAPCRQGSVAYPKKMKRQAIRARRRPGDRRAADA